MRRLAMTDRVAANFRRIFHRCASTTMSVALASLAAQAGDLGRRYLAGPLGVHIAHPFSDPRLVSLMLGSQARFRSEPGRRKPLLALATRGILPEEIRTRRVKAHFGAPLYLGLARNAPALEAMIRAMPAPAADLFESETLVACLRLAAAGVRTRFGIEAIARLNLTLALIAWLSHHEKWLRAALPSAKVVARPPYPAGAVGLAARNRSSAPPFG